MRRVATDWLWLVAGTIGPPPASILHVCRFSRVARKTTHRIRNSLLPQAQKRVSCWRNSNSRIAKNSREVRYVPEHQAATPARARQRGRDPGRRAAVRAQGERVSRPLARQPGRVRRGGGRGGRRYARPARPDRRAGRHARGARSIMTIAIRPATTADLAAVRDVHRQAFGGRPNEAYLVELLHAAGNAPVSLVATVDGNVVGHVLFSEVSLSPPGPAFQAVGLAPVGVLPAYQRQGIGARLIRAGLGAARAAGYRAAVVLGSPAYCGRFGFVRAA